MASNPPNIFVVWASPQRPSSEGPDILATCFAERVASRTDLNLVYGRVLSVADTIEILESATPHGPCGLILVGLWLDETTGKECMAKRSDIVIVEVDVTSDIVYLDVPNPSLEHLLTTLHELVQQVERNAAID